jgi:hypothetical protein
VFNLPSPAAVGASLTSLRDHLAADLSEVTAVLRDNKEASITTGVTNGVFRLCLRLLPDASLNELQIWKNAALALLQWDLSVPKPAEELLAVLSARYPEIAEETAAAEAVRIATWPWLGRPRFQHPS